MVELISLKQHGASIKFIFLAQDEYCEKITDDHNIHNIVIIKLKIISSYDNGYYRKDIYIQMKKHDNVKDWPVTLFASINNSYEKFGMSLIWPDWRRIGSNVRKDHIEVDITITITKNPSIISIRLHEDETLTDFHLCAEDGSVAFHKAFLAAHCDVFKTMFNGQWKETAEGRVELKGVTRQTIQHFKDFLYLGDLPDDGLCPLLLLGTRYLMERLKGECTMKAIQMITAENLDKHLEYALENDMHEFINTILELVPGDIFASACAIKMKALMCKTDNE